MKLTRESVNALRSKAGGFTQNTMKALGMSMTPRWPPTGWIDRLIGTEIDDSVYFEALERKDLSAMDIKAIEYADKQANQIFDHLRLYKPKSPTVF